MRPIDTRPFPLKPLACVVIVCLFASVAPLPLLAQTTAVPPKPLSTPLMALGWQDLSRSEEHTSELQSQSNLGCPLPLVQELSKTPRATRGRIRQDAESMAQQIKP